MDTRTITFLPCGTLVYGLKETEIIAYQITRVTVEIIETMSNGKTTISYKATNGSREIYFNPSKIGSEVFLDKKDIIKKLVSQL